MLTIGDDNHRFCGGHTRRSVIRIGSLGLGGLALPDLLRAEAASGATSRKSIINILLTGGPSHLDMFDMKPDAPTEIRGEFAPIATSLPGVEICELMPRLAEVMHKSILIRSLTGGLDDHNTHQCCTGWESHPKSFDSPEVSGYPEGGWPSMGGVISKLQGPAVAGMPAAVDLTPVYYDARFMLKHRPCKAGFLGPAHEGFQIQAVNRKEITLTGIGLRQLDDRRALLAGLDRFRRAADDGPIEAWDTFNQRAFDVMTSPRLAEALDLDREDAHTKARYGLDARPKAVRGGPKEIENLLLARRVIQAGARLVTLTLSRYPFGRMSQGDYNWDWHSDLFNIARATLPMIDHGIAGLIDDLDAHDMLDDVSVVVWGEFGRTPRINKNAGRDHWARVGNALLAGGGMQAGQVVGRSSRLGEDVEDRPVHFRDIIATLYHNVGIDPATLHITDPSGRPHSLVDGRSAMPELV